MVGSRMRAGGRWVVSAVPLVVVVVAPAVASWVGLMGVGREWLGLHGLWAVLVPLVFDGAALYAASLSLRSVLAGDSALVDRVLVWVYALGSASLNFSHGDQVGGPAGASFFGAASVSAVVLWDRTLRSYQRDALRELGAIEPPLPRFRVLRWVVAPGETARAWRLAVVEGVTSPVEALAMSRGVVEPVWPAIPSPWVEVAAVELPVSEPAVEVGPAVDEPIGYEQLAAPTSSPWGEVGPVELTPTFAELRMPLGEAAGLPLDMPIDYELPEEPAGPEPRVLVELAACETKAAQLAVAWRELGVYGVPVTTDVMPAVVWLADHGVRIDRSRAYDVRRKLDRSQRALSVQPKRLALTGGLPGLRRSAVGSSQGGDQ